MTTYVSSAQALEIGGGLGTSYATGDVTRGFELDELGLAGQVFVRYNLSNVVSVRAMAWAGQIKGDDETHPIDPFATVRGFSFKRKNFEASTLVEYNFLDYKERKSLVNWSPYFFAGFGLSVATNRQSRDEYRQIQPVIPFGVGIKYRLNEQWNLEFEFGARKTFYDGVDRISDIANPNKLNPAYGNWLDNDWYYFAGVSVSYTFYSIPCPFNSY
jgi:hypothetical protein